MGRACTCVVTEYHYHDDVNFALEVEYFTLEELREQFSELLQSYRIHHLHETQDTGMTADDRRDLHDKAKAAEDTFQAAFRDHLEQDERFLLDNPQENVLQTLLTWATSTGLPVVEGTSMLPRVEFARADMFSDHLMELTSEPVRPSEPSKWPFIRKIRSVARKMAHQFDVANGDRVYLNAYILSKGLILVDLPGTCDPVVEPFPQMLMIKASGILIRLD